MCAACRAERLPAGIAGERPGVLLITGSLYPFSARMQPPILVHEVLLGACDPEASGPTTVMTARCWRFRRASPASIAGGHRSSRRVIEPYLAIQPVDAGCRDRVAVTLSESGDPALGHHRPRSHQTLPGVGLGHVADRAPGLNHDALRPAMMFEVVLQPAELEGPATLGAVILAIPCGVQSVAARSSVCSSASRAACSSARASSGVFVITG